MAFTPLCRKNSGVFRKKFEPGTGLKIFKKKTIKFTSARTSRCQLSAKFPENFFVPLFNVFKFQLEINLHPTFLVLLCFALRAHLLSYNKRSFLPKNRYTLRMSWHCSYKMIHGELRNAHQVLWSLKNCLRVSLTWNSYTVQFMNHTLLYKKTVFHLWVTNYIHNNHFMTFLTGINFTWSA